MSMFELGGIKLEKRPYLALPSFVVIVQLIASDYIQLMLTCLTTWLYSFLLLLDKIGGFYQHKLKLKGDATPKGLGEPQLCCIHKGGDQ